MSLFLKHNCGDSTIRCFDCSKQICRDCMVNTKSSVLCKKCMPKKWNLLAVKELLRLQLATFSYSFAAFGVLSVFTACSA